MEYESIPVLVSGRGETFEAVDEMTIRFHIPGQPVGKGRPRIARRGSHAAMYTPAKTASYEGLVAHAAALAMDGAALIETPCAVSLDIAMLVPASWPKYRRQAAIEGRVRPGVKPDLDNVAKAIFDGCNGVLWRDDVLVTTLIAHKRYSATPGVTVEVSVC